MLRGAQCRQTRSFAGNGPRRAAPPGCAIHSVCALATGVLFLSANARLSAMDAPRRGDGWAAPRTSIAHALCRGEIDARPCLHSDRRLRCPAEPRRSARFGPTKDVDRCGLRWLLGADPAQVCDPGL